MIADPAAVAARWAQGPVDAASLVFCPPRELTRSPAAARIGQLSAEAGLFCFHFEHRVHLPLPEHHVPAAALALVEPPVWEGGVLPEPKYQSFRHDLPLGSFHPQHRGKWTAHELCHGLVGFGWSPRATPFFHATAGRLAELLPVALWYWFDEAFARRCPLHAGGGALFRAFCPDCEAAQGFDPDDDRAEQRIADGLAFMEAELAAVDRTRRSGSVVPHRFATLDLASDGVAYARAHGERLASPEFAAFIERFAVAGQGWSTSLDDLQERCLAVTRALLSGESLAPVAPSALHARWRWILQDVAWRLMGVQAQTGGDAHAGIGLIIDTLAGVLGATTEADRDPAAEVSGALMFAGSAYGTLFEDFELPDPDDVFAVGYPVDGLRWRPGLGAPSTEAGAMTQLRAGLADVCASSLERAPDALWELVQRDQEQPVRAPLADRWAAALPAGDAEAVARFEAAVAVVPRRVKATLGGPGKGLWRRVPGVRIERFDRDVLALVEGRDAEETELVLGFAASDGEPVVVGLDPAVATLLEGLPGPLALDPQELSALADLGLIEPAVRLESFPE